LLLFHHVLRTRHRVAGSRVEGQLAAFEPSVTPEVVAAGVGHESAVTERQLDPGTANRLARYAVLDD
jgi:hypothetical protein